jgi:hypothetical protein
MRLLTRSLAAAGAICAWQLLLPAANAQAPTPEAKTAPQAETPSPGLSEPSHNIPDDKLDKAAAAIKSVVTVQQDYRERMSTAGPTEKENIAHEAVDALTKAVTDHGLSVEEYSSILEVAQNDPAIREKILQRIRPREQ